MSRGVLDEKAETRLVSQLPDAVALQSRIFELSPISISHKFHPDSTIPVAVACLRDTANTLAQARYALYESLAHKIWYLERTDLPDDLHANFFALYYADDTALRLYSSAEHLACGIINMLEIKSEDLAKHKEARVSRQSCLKKYLCKEKPEHAITKVVKDIAESEAWVKTIKYRGDWVHSQPPLIKGIGVNYNRERRWQKDNTGRGYEMEIRFGDAPMYTIDDLIGFIQPALCQFTEGVKDIVEYYFDLIGE